MKFDPKNPPSEEELMKIKTAFIFTSKRYFIGYWHIALPDALSRFGLGANIAATIWRPVDGPQNKWYVQIRQRHYRRRDVNNEVPDEFKWMWVEKDGTEEEVRKHLDVTMEMLARGGLKCGGIKLTVEYVELKRTGEECLPILQRQDYMHVSQVIKAK